MTEEQFISAYREGYQKTVSRQKYKGDTQPEDTAAQAWAMAWKYRDRYRSDGPILNWVHIIARNIRFRSMPKEKRYAPLGDFIPVPFDYNLDNKRDVELILGRMPKDKRQHLVQYMNDESVPRIRVFRAKKIAREMSNLS